MPSHDSEKGNFFKFKDQDVFINRIKTKPKAEFFIYSGLVYYNNENQLSSNPNTPRGHVNLHELNVNRSGAQLIYPFITKYGSFNSFSTISTSEFNQDFAAGDEIAGNYVNTASIVIDRYGTTMDTGKTNFLYAIKNALNYNTIINPRYAYSSSFGDKETQTLNVVKIPSIFYGSSIDKGSVVLKYYVTGNLIAEASDTKRNGELIQTSGSTTGQSVGLVMYDHGFIILTSSAAVSDHVEAYLPGSATKHASSWQYFGATSSYANSLSSSFVVKFNGVNYVETLTMFAHAKKNQLNFSNNLSYLSTGSLSAHTGSRHYIENPNINIKNIVSSSYKAHSASFQPTTYISKIGIYDKDKNLIAIAGLANPVKKTEDRNFTFKLKLDI